MVFASDAIQVSKLIALSTPYKTSVFSSLAASWVSIVNACIIKY
jgi:hypothetical protein